MSETSRRLSDQDWPTTPPTPDEVQGELIRWNVAANEAIKAIWALGQPEKLMLQIGEVVGGYKDLAEPSLTQEQRSEIRIKLGRAVGEATAELLKVQEELDSG